MTLPIVYSQCNQEQATTQPTNKIRKQDKINAYRTVIISRLLTGIKHKIGKLKHDTFVAMSY